MHNSKSSAQLVSERKAHGCGLLDSERSRFEGHALYGVSIKTSREEIVVLPDWSAYHERSGRGSITSSRPTVLSFQLLFNYANCPPPSPGLLRFASRPGSGDR